MQQAAPDLAVTSAQYIGNAVRMRRIQMGMTQKDLANSLSTSQELISKYEKGATSIRADEIPRFAAALSVTPAYFFQSTDEGSYVAPQYGVRGEENIFSEYEPLKNVFYGKGGEVVDREGAVLMYFRLLGETAQILAIKLLRELARFEKFSNGKDERKDTTEI